MVDGSIIIRLSPTRNAFDKAEISFFTKCSICTGGIFSPPAVMISSLILPVMYTKPLLSIYPISPVLSHPSSIASFVFSSSSTRN